MIRRLVEGLRFVPDPEDMDIPSAIFSDQVYLFNLALSVVSILTSKKKLWLTLA